MEFIRLDCIVSNVILGLILAFANAIQIVRYKNKHFSVFTYIFTTDYNIVFPFSHLNSPVRQVTVSQTWTFILKYKVSAVTYGGIFCRKPVNLTAPITLCAASLPASWSRAAAGRDPARFYLTASHRISPHLLEPSAVARASGWTRKTAAR